jgi:transposase
MRATIQGYGQSGLFVKQTGIEIQLPARVFGKGWKDLKEHVAKAIGQWPSHVFQPRIMTQRGKGEHAPRWKESKVDALSGLMYLLKVPVTHELVSLWQVIDWGEINRIAAPLYNNAHGGCSAWAPAQLMALLILMFLYGVVHETQVVARVRENIVWCWFCGFGLFGPFPAHDVLYEFRKRLGQEKFEELLTMVVRACLEAKLVSNELAHFDLTPVSAAAHRWSPYERAVILSRALMRYLELVWAEQTPEEPFPEALRELAIKVAIEYLPHKGIKDVKPERIVASVEQWEQQAQGSEPVWQTTSDAIVETLAATEEPLDLRELIKRPNDKLRAWLKGRAKKVLEQMPHARGDQEARVGRTTNYTWFCGYLMGFMVDNAHQVITAVAWAAGNVKQYKTLKPALKAHIQRLGQPKTLATDSAFDEFEVHSVLEQQDITGHISSRDHSQPRDGGYGTDRVTWVEGSQQPLCPAAKSLKATGQAQDGRQIFVGTACAKCTLYARCYPSGEGQPKRFTLHPAAHRRWQENRTHCQSPAYKVAQRDRFTSEGRFGLAKMNHHGARAPYRSANMNRIAGLMIAIVMNFRILARHHRQEAKPA